MWCMYVWREEEESMYVGNGWQRRPGRTNCCIPTTDSTAGLHEWVVMWLRGLQSSQYDIWILQQPFSPLLPSSIINGCLAVGTTFIMTLPIILLSFTLLLSSPLPYSPLLSSLLPSPRPSSPLLNPPILSYPHPSSSSSPLFSSHHPLFSTFCFLPSTWLSSSSPPLLIFHSSHFPLILSLLLFSSNPSIHLPLFFHPLPPFYSSLPSPSSPLFLSFHFLTSPPVKHKDRWMSQSEWGLSLFRFQ